MGSNLWVLRVIYLLCYLQLHSFSATVATVKFVFESVQYREGYVVSSYIILYLYRYIYISDIDGYLLSYVKVSI